MDWISDLLWPRRCVRCGAMGAELCAGCRAALIRSPAVRRVGDLAVMSAATMDDEELSRIIWNCKYRNLPHLAEPLAAWWADSIGRLPDVRRHIRADSLLVPVPLHPHRLAERGYNQAELLASALSRIMALPTDPTALARMRNTSSQVQRATRSERLANMRGAFIAQESVVAGRDIIVVDDVSTTGATLTACASALRAAGARSVVGLVIARG